MKYVQNRYGLAMLAGVAAVTMMPTARAQSPHGAPMRWDLPAQDLSDALVAAGKASGREIIFSDTDVAGRRAPALIGAHSPEAAIALLLEGSGLVAEWRDGSVIVRRRQAAEDETGSDIVVTGSRIRGASPATPVIRVTGEDIRNAGQADLGETLRSIPQNFNGGQNPGVGSGVRGADNININSASSPNLRGLGPDATLTLVNGRRLAYGGVNNAVDISAIPVDAVDRVELVADGTSALYGSDAVAGVVNILLKRDFDGLSASGRWGAATEGGDVEQQYGLVGGTDWDSGSFIAAWDWSKTSAILARQRDYASALQADTTLYPEQKAQSAVLSAHQQLAPGVRLSADALYSTRKHRIQAPFSADQPYDQFGTLSRADSERFSIAPELTVALPANWSLAAGLVYAEDRTRLSTILAVGGVDQYDTRICFCNALTTAELSADGGLFDLPAGTVRIALGAGYRENILDQQRRRFSFVGAPTQQSLFRARQESWYGYGELFMPLVAPHMEVPGLDRLSLSAALRYENYPGMDEVATPKLGLVLEPNPDLSLSASWGKSFKAPTLYQQFLDQQTLLLNAAGLGTGYPAGSTVLYISGGNPDLSPERSTNWTATFALHPRALAGFELELSYFDVAYDRRVIEPIPSAAGVLDNPVYAGFVTLSPSPAQIEATIAASGLGLNNLTGRPFNPASVVGIVDNRFTNVSRQRAQGVDIAGRYRIETGADGTLTLSASASYLESRRQLLDTQDFAPLAGTIFNPPHWRARAGATWADGGLTLSGWFSYTGGVTDDRTTSHDKVSGQTSLDLTLRYRTEPGQKFSSNMEFALMAQNILNDEPDTIRTDVVQYTPYDSTNYSSIGRFVGLSITKRWQ